MVSTVAANKPPIIAAAIGAQKMLDSNGIIARIAAAAVKMIGLKRVTVASIMAWRASIFAAMFLSI